MRSAGYRRRDENDRRALKLYVRRELVRCAPTSSEAFNAKILHFDLAAHMRLFDVQFRGFDCIFDRRMVQKYITEKNMDSGELFVLSAKSKLNTND